MAIVVTSQFDLQTTLPLDIRTVAADLTARDAISASVRFEGLIVYVVAEETNFQLVGGITNGDWAELSGGGGGMDLSDYSEDTIDGTDVTLVPTTTVVRLTAAGTLVSIEEIAAGVDGDVLVLINSTGVDVIVKDQAGPPGSTIITGQFDDVYFRYLGALMFRYGDYSQGWELIGEAIGTTHVLPGDLDVDGDANVDGDLAVGGELDLEGALLRGATDGITAFAGGGQGSAVQLTTDFNRITTCATAGDSVKFPVAKVGAQIVIVNSGAASANVFPATGEAIDAGAANAASALGPGTASIYTCFTAGTWRSLPLGSGGSLLSAVRNLSASGNVLSTDGTVTLTASAALDATLPAASAALIGKTFEFLRTDATSFVVTVLAAGADTFVNASAAASETIPFQGGTLRVRCLSATTWGLF